MTPAARARTLAGLTIQEAARRAHISARYLRHVEHHGASYPLALRLARLYDTRIDIFLGGRGRPPIASRFRCKRREAT